MFICLNGVKMLSIRAEVKQSLINRHLNWVREPLNVPSSARTGLLMPNAVKTRRLL